MNDFSFDYLKYRLARVLGGTHYEDSIGRIRVDEILNEIDRYGYKLVKKEESSVVINRSGNLPNQKLSYSQILGLMNFARRRTRV